MSDEDMNPSAPGPGSVDGSAAGAAVSEPPPEAIRIRPPSSPAVPTAADEYEAAWAVAAPGGEVWTARPWVPPSERASTGRAARKRVPRVSHATLELASN